MNTLPFQPNKQQLEAIARGATKIWIPIDSSVHSIIKKPDSFESARKFPCDCGGVFPIGGCTDCYNTGIIFDLDCECMKEFVLEYSPLQPEKPYFVQEEFDRLGRRGHTLYKQANPGSEHITAWQPADQMTEAQSQYKFTVGNVVVKQVQYLTIGDGQDLITSINQPHISLNDGTWAKYFTDWHDSQYPEQPYSQKPCGFLVTIERN